MAPLLLTGEDALRINSWGSVAGLILAIEGRLISDEDCIVPIAESHTPNSDRSIHSTIIGLNDGALATLQVRLSSGSAKRGGVFVTVEIVRGVLGAIQSLGILAAGYVVNGLPLAFPGPRPLSSLDGPGSLLSLTGADPAAGAEWSFTVPVGARWRVKAITAPLVTSSAVANRFPNLIVDDGAKTVFQVGTDQAQTASTTTTYSIAEGIGLEGNSDNVVLGTLPVDLRLPAGFRLRSLTTALDAGDNWGAPQILVEEWIEP